MKLSTITINKTINNVLFKQYRTLSQINKLESEVTNINRPKRYDNTVQDEAASDPTDRFKFIKQLNVVTKDRTHTLEISCDRAIKLMKLGSFNKSILVQYCHYLVHLINDTCDEERFYYQKVCLDVFNYIIRNRDDLPDTTLNSLLANVSGSGRENCRSVFKLYIDTKVLDPDAPNLAGILRNCYQFQLWEEAQRLVCCNSSAVSAQTTEAFASAVISASEKYKSLSSPGKESFQKCVVQHLLYVLNQHSEKRIQVILDDPEKFIDAIRELGFSIVKNPDIKETGRCKRCSDMLPLFDSVRLRSINEATLVELKKVLKGNLYLNSSPKEVELFQSYLQDLYNKTHRPLDIVIDGLNIAYKNNFGRKYVTREFGDGLQRTQKLQDPDFQARMLINIIIKSGWLRDRKSILVIGRTHMMKWPGLVDFFNKQSIAFYSFNNMSKDDLFLIYAATISPKTRFVTNDHLRDHMIRLSDSVKVDFEKWMDTHQIWINYNNLRPIVATPYMKTASVSKDSRFIHVPVFEKQVVVSDKLVPPLHLDAKATTWICAEVPQI